MNCHPPLIRQADRPAEYVRLCEIGRRGREWEQLIASASPFTGHSAWEWNNLPIGYNTPIWEMWRLEDGPHPRCKDAYDVRWHIKPPAFGWLEITCENH